MASLTPAAHTGAAHVGAPLALPQVGISTHTLSQARRALLIGITLFIAAALYYFIGVDEGMTSVFGHSMVIHEWVHDSRHFLGFPCH